MLYLYISLSFSLYIIIIWSDFLLLLLLLLFLFMLLAVLRVAFRISWAIHFEGAQVVREGEEFFKFYLSTCYS